MKAVYTAHATATGGRDGQGRTDDGKIDVKLDLPEGQRESEADLDFHAVRAGLSWHFNGL